MRCRRLKMGTGRGGCWSLHGLRTSPADLVRLTQEVDLQWMIVRTRHIPAASHPATVHLRPGTNVQWFPHLQRQQGSSMLIISVIIVGAATEVGVCAAAPACPLRGPSAAVSRPVAV